MDAIQAAAVAYNNATLDNDGASKGEDAGMGGGEAGTGTGAGEGAVDGGTSPVVPVATSVMAEAALLASTRVIEADQTVRYQRSLYYKHSYIHLVGGG